MEIRFDEQQKQFQQQLVDQWFVVGISASVLTVKLLTKTDNSL